MSVAEPPATRNINTSALSSRGRTTVAATAAGHEWTVRWMDGTAISCGTIFDDDLGQWRVWVACNRTLLTGGPAFADEDAATAHAHRLQRDWLLDLTAGQLATFNPHHADYLRRLPD